MTQMVLYGNRWNGYSNFPYSKCSLLLRKR